MKNLLHTMKSTPLLHLTLLISTRILFTLACTLVLFMGTFAFAQATASPAASLDDPTVFLKVIFDAIENKNWGVAAAAVLVLLVALFRTFGKKIHDMIPDDSAWDKPFFFLYESKLGGWVLNTVTATAGGFGTALLAGATIDFTLVRTILGISFTAAGIWSAVKDAMEYFGKAKVPPTDGAAKAGADAAANPGTQLNG